MYHLFEVEIKTEPLFFSVGSSTLKVVASDSESEKLHFSKCVNKRFCLWPMITTDKCICGQDECTRFY